MSKPNWEDAPKWSRWLARDKSGVWYWHEEEPRVCGYEWVSDGLIDRHDISWNESKEARP